MNEKLREIWYIVVPLLLIGAGFVYLKILDVEVWWKWATGLASVVVAYRFGIKMVGKYTDLNKSPALQRLENYNADKVVDESLYRDKLNALYKEVDALKARLPKPPPPKPPQPEPGG